MEGVGARFGRTSSRYATASSSSSVFKGPVRKWKKKWVHISPPINNASSSQHSQTTNHNGNNGSHLLLYKWTAISQSRNNSDGDKSSAKDGGAAAEEEPPRRKFKYMPIAVLEEHKDEAAEMVDDEAKPIDTDSNGAQPTSDNDVLDEEPDINDMPIGESEAPNDTSFVRQDLNQSTLDLGLGLNGSDGEDSRLERLSSRSAGT